MLRQFLHIWMAYRKLFAFRFFFRPFHFSSFSFCFFLRVFFLLSILYFFFFLFSLSLPRFVCKAHGRTHFPYITNNIWYFKKDVPFFRVYIVVAFFLALRNNWCLVENILRYNISCMCFFSSSSSSSSYTAAAACSLSAYLMSSQARHRSLCFSGTSSSSSSSMVFIDLPCFTLLSYRFFHSFRLDFALPNRVFCFFFSRFVHFHLVHRFPFAIFVRLAWKSRGKEPTQWAHYLKYSILFP